MAEMDDVSRSTSQVVTSKHLDRVRESSSEMLAMPNVASSTSRDISAVPVKVRNTLAATIKNPATQSTISHAFEVLDRSIAAYASMASEFGEELKQATKGLLDNRAMVASEDSKNLGLARKEALGKTPGGRSQA